jgi:hypothetical protein
MGSWLNYRLDAWRLGFDSDGGGIQESEFRIQEEESGAAPAPSFWLLDSGFWMLLSAFKRKSILVRH